MDVTARHALPLIAPGQAQKELSHNEALSALDILVQPAVIASGTEVPPTAPEAGQCWRVGAAPTGDWAGRADTIACWTAGGWRFAAPTEGMTVCTGGDTGFARFAEGEWRDGAIVGATLALGGEQVVGPRLAAIEDASGGSVIDSEARDAINAILERLRGHGLIES